MIREPKRGSSWRYSAEEAQQVQDLVKASAAEGLGRAQMLQAMPMHERRMTYLLKELCAARKIAGHGIGRWVRYYEPAMAARLDRLKRERLTGKGAPNAPISDEDEDCPVPVRRILIDARQAPPLMPAGPRSVFDLAMGVAA